MGLGGSSLSHILGIIPGIYREASMIDSPKYMLHIESRKGPDVRGPFTGTMVRRFGRWVPMPPRLGLLTDLTLAGIKWKWVRV